MKLLGSNSSPYVRRVRMYAIHQYIKLEFVNLDIFSPSDRQIMINNNPAGKIPILIDEQQRVTDSSIIIRYFLDKYHLTRLSWPQENILTVINACNDSLVEMLLCQRSGFNTNDDKLFFNLQNERIVETLSYLDTHLTDEEFKGCEYLNISLYCLLDWICFRELTDFSQHSELVAFYEQYSKRQAAINTSPSL